MFSLEPEFLKGYFESMTLANYLTFSRLLITPLFLILYVWHDWFGISSLLLPYILLALFIISELSDAMDGLLARRMNQVTDLGKLLDPMADSIYRITIFLCFTQAPVNLPIILVFIFLYRDSMISTLRTICALKGFTLAARTSGKIKAVVQAFAAALVLLLMIPESVGIITQETLSQAGTGLISIAALYSLYSGGEYLLVNRSFILKLMRRES